MTGGLITERDTSLFLALRKQHMLKKYSKEAWLDIKLKSLTADSLISLKLEKIRGAFYESIPNELESRIFQAADNNDTPGLTKHVLASLLSAYEIDFESRPNLSDYFQ